MVFNHDIHTSISLVIQHQCDDVMILVSACVSMEGSPIQQQRATLDQYQLLNQVGHRTTVSLRIMKCSYESTEETELFLSFAMQRHVYYSLPLS